MKSGEDESTFRPAHRERAAAASLHAAPTCWVGAPPPAPPPPPRSRGGGDGARLRVTPLSAAAARGPVAGLGKRARLLLA